MIDSFVIYVYGNTHLYYNNTIKCKFFYLLQFNWMNFISDNPIRITNFGEFVTCSFIVNILQ